MNSRPGCSSTQLTGVVNTYENWTHLRSQTTYTDSGGTTTHQFDYDDELGYLTGASYNGGTTWDTWGYDAAGNRISESHGSSSSTAFTYDNLNRMTQSARWNGSSFGTAFSYANDFLGNRVSRGSSTSQGSGYTLYTWDHVNRLKKTVSASNGATFTYRPDGLRADKIKSHVLSWNVTGEDSGYYDEDEDTNQPTTRYFYDGQMTVEEDYIESVIGDVIYFVTRYALGARGVDCISKYDEISDEHTYSYPVYDGHGNMIATLSRSGSSFALDNERLYDAWGVVKTGSATGGPTNRYVASIGHQQDDESDLIYMRARYYEPWSGRFVSEDPVMDGWNWYSYCHNDPVSYKDASGTTAVSEFGEYLLKLAISVAIFVFFAGGIKEYTKQTHKYGSAQSWGRIVAKGAQDLVKGVLTMVLGAGFLDVCKTGLVAGASRGEVFGVVLAATAYAIFIGMFIGLMGTAMDSLIDVWFAGGGS